MDHILQCPSRDPVHNKYIKQFTDLMRDNKIPNDIVRMFETGIDIAILTPLRFSYDGVHMDEDDIMTDDRVTEIITDETIREDRRAAFTQQTRIGWTKIFLGYFTTSWRTSTENLEFPWVASCIRLFLDWGRACWTHRNNHLYGPSKKRHKQKRQRLQAEARVWLEAPKRESLVPLQRSARFRRDLTRATTETISTWLLKQQTLRKLIRKRRRANIISYFQSEASMEILDRTFQRKLIEARRGTRVQSDTDTTNEEPPN